VPEQGVGRSECPKHFVGQALAALRKSRNAGLVHLGGSLRASQEGGIRGVMSLGKGWAIPGEPCLAATPFLAR